MPSLGMMTVNALVAADSVLIPVQAAYLSYIDQTVQKWLCEYIHDNGVIKQEQIAALRSRLDSGSINQSQMISILNENLKGRLPAVKVNLTEKKLRK